MAEVPVSLNDLDSIVYNVSRDLIEERAVNGSIDGITEETAKAVTDDVFFVINRYMYYINEIMENKNLQSATKIDLE